MRGDHRERWRTHGIGVQTIYEWRKRYGGMSKSEFTAMKTMQEANRPAEKS